MNQVFPLWIQNISIISSVIGLVVTVFLFIEAREIKKSFIRKARLPDLNNELNSISSKLNDILNNWDKKDFMVELGKLRGMLEQGKAKLHNDDKEAVGSLLKSLEVVNSELSEDQAWELYTNFQYVTSRLQQTEKDSKWD